MTASDQETLRKLCAEFVIMKRELFELRVQKEVHRCVITAMRQISSCLDPEFKRLSAAHLEGFGDYLYSIGLPADHAITKTMLDEVESLMAEAKPLRDTLQVIQGGAPA